MLSVTKIIISSFIFILILGNISAFDFDNVKRYNEVSKEITVVNSFGLGDEIAKIKLNTELIEVVPRGYNKVAEIEISSYSDYENALKQIEFYDLKNENEKIIREFDFKLKSYIDIDVNDYETICIKEQDSEKNLSLVNRCETKIIGTHKENVESWEDFTTKDLLDGETYTLGIFTEVKAGDKVEWIPEIFGIKINEWAVWTEALNIGLKTYYNFNETTGTNVRDLVQGKNGTSTGVSFTTGIVNGAYDYDGASSRVQFPGSIINKDGNWSYNIWMNPDALTPATRFFNVRNDSVMIMAINENFVGENETEIYFGGVWRNTNIPLVNSSWAMITLTYNGSTLKAYKNGSLLYSAPDIPTAPDETLNYLGATSGGTLYFNGKLDELGTWNRTLTDSEISDLWNGGVGISYTNLFNLDSLEVVLQNPTNDTITKPEDLFFSANQTATGTIEHDNSTLLVWNKTDNTLKYSNTITLLPTNGTFLVQWNNTNWSQQIGEGLFYWNVLGCGSNLTTTICDYGDVNKTFELDLYPPEINIISPKGNIPYLSAGGNLSLNWSIYELAGNITDHLSNCSYTYNGTITQLSKTACLITNYTSFTYLNGINRVYMNVTDELNYINSNYTDFNIYVLENNEYSYNTQTTEGNIETFIQNITLGDGISVSSVEFIYNNTNYTGQKFTSGSKNILIMDNFVIPAVTSSLNNTFYWKLILSDSQEINLSSRTQEVYNIGLDNCSSFSYTLYNLTALDEDIQTLIVSPNIEVSVNIYDFNRDNEISSYNLSSSNNPTRICLSNSLLNSTYVVDAIFKYTASDYSVEYYNIYNSNLTANTLYQNISLYSLAFNRSTDFQLTFTGSDYLPVENALVYVKRQYVAEDQYKTVELPLTDSNGQSVLHLVRNDILYNIVVVKDGEIIGNFERIIAFCQDYTIGSCALNLNAVSSTTPIFDYEEYTNLIIEDPTYDNDTGEVSFNFLTVDGTTKTVLMSVERNDVLGNSTICNDSVTSSGGTLICNVGDIDDSLLKIRILVDGIEVIQDYVSLGKTNYGSIGFFVLLLISFILMMLFGDTKEGLLLSVALSFIAGIGLGIATGTVIGYLSSGIAILVMVIAGIWRLNQEGKF